MINTMECNETIECECNECVEEIRKETIKENVNKKMTSDFIINGMVTVLSKLQILTLLDIPVYNDEKNPYMIWDYDDLLNTFGISPIELFNIIYRNFSSDVVKELYKLTDEEYNYLIN